MAACINKWLGSCGHLCVGAKLSGGGHCRRVTQNISTSMEVDPPSVVIDRSELHEEEMIVSESEDAVIVEAPSSMAKVTHKHKGQHKPVMARLSN